MAIRTNLSLGNWHLAPVAIPRLGLRAMLRALQTRRELAGMDDRMLRDLGINRLEALREANRAPWDLRPRG